MPPTPGVDQTSAPPGAPEQAPAPGARPHRRALLAGGLAALAAAAVGTGVAVEHRGGGSSPKSSPTATASSAAPRPWSSGASGNGTPSGGLAAWRGRALDITGTWADNDDAMVALYQLQSDGDYASWTKPLDIAIGAIAKGESWGAAAKGAYDERWTASLTNLAKAWSTRSSTLYVRFAHEMNGNWYPWAVTAGSASAFTVAWQRFRDLQTSILPAAKLVFCVNRESSPGGTDWRRYFPGPQHVDVMGVDYYNQSPAVSTQSEWDASVVARDRYGAPKGLERHREFAASVERPLAVPEWSGNAASGDSPLFIKEMHAFFGAHGGTGAGQLLYEILFNADNDGGAFQLYARTLRMPRSSREYQRLW